MVTAPKSMILNMLKTPQQVREEQLQKLRQQSTAQAQLLGAPVSATTALPGLLRSFAAGEMSQQAVDLNQAARRAAGALGGMFGMAGKPQAQEALRGAFMSPEERQAVKAQDIMKGLDTNDPAALKEAAKQLSAIGLTGAATQLSERAEGIVDRLRTRGFQDTAEARAAAAEARALEEEKRRAAEELRKQGADERQVQDWMEANKDRLLQRVRAEKAERRAAAAEARAITKDQYDEWTRQNTKEKQASLLSIAKDANQLKALGFSDDQATNISTTTTPQAYYSMIEERMKQLAEKGVDSQDASTAMQNANAYMDAMDELIALRENPEASPADIKRAESKLRSIGMTAQITDTNVNFVAIKDAKEAGQAARIQSQEASRVISWMEANKGEMLSGLAESTRQAFSNLFGAQTPRDVINAKYTEIYTKEVINNLPPGVASDKDVALVLQGTLPANASPEQMINYMSGLQKIAEARAAYNDEFNEYMRDPLNEMRIEGFPSWYSEKQRKAKIEQLIEYGITEENAANYVDAGDLAFARVVQAYESARTGGADTELNNRARALGIQVGS